jgi:hypothetical protein
MAHNIFKHAFISILLATATVSCINNDGRDDTYYSVTISNTMPDGVGEDVTIQSGKIKYTELNTGETTTLALPQYDPFTVASGLYDIEATIDVTYTNSDGQSVTRSLRAIQSSVAITSDTTISLDWFFYNPNTSLVFSEIYITGSPNATSTGGIRDTYFKIYNNTNQVIYADGIALVESALVNAKANAFEILTEANNRQVNFTVGTIWVIPGNGTEHPINPGESIKIVDQAIDWSAQVSGALNQTDADYEWWDDNAQDTDNPSVPNLNKWYCYSATIWIPSNQANRSYALVKFPEGTTADSYLTNYYGPYEYISTIGSNMTNDKAYLIPNEWILDGVNLSNKEVWVYGALGDAIDMSYASVSDKNRDPERFGKKFRRRIAETTSDGRQILMDTDDSAADFELVSVNE